MVAICQFKIPKKFEIVGKSLNDSQTDAIVNSIVHCLVNETAILTDVRSFCDQTSNFKSEIVDDSTFIELILILDEHQIRDFKIYENLIFDKAIESFKHEEHYISKYLTVDNHEFIGFETVF